MFLFIKQAGYCNYIRVFNDAYIDNTDYQETFYLCQTSSADEVRKLIHLEKTLS